LAGSGIFSRSWPNVVFSRPKARNSSLGVSTTVVACLDCSQVKTSRGIRRANSSTNFVASMMRIRSNSSGTSR
jgi:hypothetical protein